MPSTIHVPHYIQIIRRTLIALTSYTFKLQLHCTSSKRLNMENLLQDFTQKEANKNPSPGGFHIKHKMPIAKAKAPPGP